jgi:hypothetical protein
MAKMGKYCKAYMLPRLRQFAEWSENSANLRKEEKSVEGKQVLVPRQLTDQDHLYLQESLVVTDGIFIDENVIFDKITPEWEAFCKKELQFEVPDLQPKMVASAPASMDPLRLDRNGSPSE